MRRWSRRIALRWLVGVALVGVPNGANAECVMLSGWICGSFERANAVFLAEIEDVRNLPPQPTVQPGESSFRIEVDFRFLEVFKENDQLTRTLRFAPSLDGYPFKPGQRVLVYASRGRDAVWSTDCSQTRLSPEGDADLRVLRSLARGDAGGMVYGQLVTVLGGREISNRHPGRRVTLRPMSGLEPVVSATTSEAGTFRFDWVPPGDYVIAVEASPEYEPQERAVRVEREQRCLEVPRFWLPLGP